VLYTVKRLHPDPMELYSERKTDGQQMRLIIKVKLINTYLKLLALTPGKDFHQMAIGILSVMSAVFLIPKII
jgi:hypothetical protein